MMGIHANKKIAGISIINDNEVALFVFDNARIHIIAAIATTAINVVSEFWLYISALSISP